MIVHSCVFYTADISRVKEFYTKVMNLKIERENEDYISFLLDNDVRIGIKKGGTKEREIGGHGTVFIKVDKIDEFYRDMKSKEVGFYKDLTVQPWATSFSILDPDGNKIEFVDK